MTPRLERPKVEEALAGLKDFQRQTVDYVFDRLYTAPDATRRFLIADEVGLGKTLVARGVIARALDYLWDTSIQHLDVIYICSNSDIARQNINRLKLSGQADFALASRITLLPIQMQDFRRSRVNFVSFTPGTSFDLKSSMGVATERVLLYWLLQEAWGLRNVSALNVLRGDMRADRFRARVRGFDTRTIEPTLAERFYTQLRQQPTLLGEFEALCADYKRADSRVPDEIRSQRAGWIGRVRAILAESCLTALEPDLIILDEFQRFKHLLNDEDEDSQLARHLFNYSDDHAAARVILLSATPYKMYTLAHEEADDHYQDFLQTLRFLFDDPAKSERLEGLVGAYREEILRLRDRDASALHGIKQELERCLRSVMVRTERLAASEDRNGMLVQVPSPSLTLKRSDLQAYIGLAQVARLLEQPDPLEYWKSSPYLFNFMDRYDLKEAFRRALADGHRGTELLDTLRAFPQLLLPVKTVKDYELLEPGNARLRSLLADTLDAGTWRLLWIPPSMPYHALEGPFADSRAERFTKRLVFSSWRVVPKAVSVFLSYETERRIFRAAEQKPVNTQRARKRRHPLLRFARSEGRLGGLPLVGLIYPCHTLARAIDLDPLHVGARLYNDTLPSLEQILAETERGLAGLLTPLTSSCMREGMEDERWYWAAPLLLDAQAFPAFVRDWWQLDRPDKESDLAREWAAADPADPDAREAGRISSHWAEHVQEARSLLRDFYAGKLRLGPPPADLSRVLSQLSVAGFGVAALRALLRLTGVPLPPEELRDVTTNAARISWSFLSLFNLPESIALIRSLNRREPYWRRVLEYCASGGLQAILDEFVHVLRESTGLLEASPRLIAEAVAEKICEALSLRTSTPSVDRIRPEASDQPIDSFGMRGRYALRFGDEKSEDGIDPTRADRVRSAFNSPFWPFVLATTSIGQEGLDFHFYCHAVVHWNLPSNPVDLEQREGRVHRYKGHAVRKNLGRAYALPRIVASMGSGTDPWTALFRLACDDRARGASDLTPFWVYPIEGGARIERHVPALPLSRDELQLEQLRRALVIYRMVFGQSRQEDLVTYLLAHFASERLQMLMDELRIDLSPPAHSEAQSSDCGRGLPKMMTKV